MTETMPPPLFDPFAPGFTDDPYPQYAVMRAQAPVYQHPFGFWLLTRYEDVSWLLRAGLSVEDDNVATDSLLRQLREEVYGDGAPRASALSMLDRDPPDHTRLRKLVSKAFTPRAIEALRPRITELVDGMLDDMAAQRRVDLVDALAFPLPFSVIAEMLGTPPADHERIRQLTGTVVRSLEPVAAPALIRAILAADEEMSQVAAEMIAWKRANPADDLLTALIHAEDDGDALDDDELVAQTLLLYIAGHETTVNLIAGGTLALLHYPAQLALLRDDPALRRHVVEHAVDQVGDARPQRLDGPWGERLRDQLAQPGVVRRVAVEHGQRAGARRAVTVHLFAQLAEQAVGRHVVVLDRQARRPQQPGHAVVGGEQPEPERVLVHRRPLAHGRVLRIGVVGKARCERVEQRRGHGLGQGGSSLTAAVAPP